MSPAFALELARQGVSTWIGFRWRLISTGSQYSTHIDDYLFREKTVEKAFMYTRRAIHKHYPKRDRVWASSMLLYGDTR